VLVKDGADHPGVVGVARVVDDDAVPNADGAVDEACM
jgi:hypothetical protein